MFDAVIEVLGTGLCATKQSISAVRGHLNQTKRIPLWLFGWRWPAVVAELGPGVESTADPHRSGRGAAQMGRWVRTPGDYGCAGQPPRVPKPGQQVSRFPLTVAGGYLENRNRLGLLYFPPDDQRERGRETAPDEELGGFGLFFPSGWDVNRLGVGVC